MTMKKSKKKIISKRLWFSLVLLAVYAVVVLSSILVMRSLLLKNAQKMGELMLQKYCNEQRQYIYHGYDYTQVDVAVTNDLNRYTNEKYEIEFILSFNTDS